MAEKIGEFSMEHVVSSYSRNADGDIVSKTDWRGSDHQLLWVVRKYLARLFRLLHYLTVMQNQERLNLSVIRF